MHSTTKIAILSLIFSALTVSRSAFCSALPQGDTKPAAPAAQPAHAQVMLAPAQAGTTQIPSQERLPTDARKPDRILRVGHRGSVQALAFSPDRQWLASGGYDKNIIVWNLASGREEFRLGSHKETIAPPQQSLEKEAITSLTFNPDGTRLVSVNVSGVVRVWNPQTRKLLFAINPHRVHYYGGSIAFSADGKSLILAVEKRVKEDTTETAIGFYDGETGKSLRTIPTKWTMLSVLVPTTDGRLIASGTVGADDDDDPSGSVDILDANSGEIQKTYPLVASTISRDGRWMASSDENGGGHAVLWNLGDGKRTHDLPPQNAGRVVFRPDGEEVAITRGNSNAIDFVSTANGQITKSLPGGGYGLGVAAYSADGKLLAAGSYDYGTIKVWDLGTMREQVTLYGQSPVQSVAFSPDGKLLAATSGELRVWDVSNGNEVVTLTDAPVNRAVFSADGKWLASNPGGQFAGYALKIWNTSTWKEAASIPPEKGFPAFWLAFSEEKSAQQKISNTLSWPFTSEGESQIVWGSSLPMAVSEGGKWLAQPAGGSGTVEIWDASSGQKLQSIPAYRLGVIKISFSQDGRRLVTVGQDSNPMMVQGHPGMMISYPRVSVWNTATWNLEFSITFPSFTGTDAEISADGKYLAVKKGNMIQLFDLEQKQPVAALASPGERSGYVAISPDGTLLVQGALEGIRLWRLPVSKTAPN
ncbi:MAG TPA: WD40 repeat domain-containing protein [Candidatus Acidoferrum sp.]|nr:WD40 repeat domain-containing protein [Candidatus Acidoferrum sp.]